MVRYTFTVWDFHPLLLAGLPAHSGQAATITVNLSRFPRASLCAGSGADAGVNHAHARVRLIVERPVTLQTTHNREGNCGHGGAFWGRQRNGLRRKICSA